MADTIKTGIEAKVEIDQSSAESALASMIAELKSFREGWEDGGKEITKAEKSVRAVGDETHKVSILTETWKGIWQGVGQGLFSLAAAGVHGIVSETERLIDKANEFGDTFERMAARGVANAKELEAATIQLANALGTDLLETAKAVDLSTIISPEGTDHIETARAALMSLQLTGADYNQTIRDSAQLTKAYNDEGVTQAEVIAKIALASREAKVEGADLYQAVAKLAPQTKRLNISLDELLQVSVAGLKKGIQPMRMGLMGMSEVLDQVVKPSEDLVKVLAEQEVVTTKSSAAFVSNSSAVSRLKTEYESLNVQLQREKELTQEIALQISDTQRNIDRYSELSKKKEDGVRLNKLEAQEYRALGKELENSNKQLAQYDRSARFVADGEFKRLTIVEQLKQRVKNASLVQGDMEQSTKHLELESTKLTDSLKQQEDQVTRLATAMATEMPSAIQQVISETGLGGLLQRLSGSAEAMAQFSGQAQTFIAGATAAGSAASSSTEAGATGMQRLRNELDELVAGAYGAWEKLKARWENFETILVSPLSSARDSFAREFSALFSEERIAQVTAWSEELGDEISGSVGEMARQVVKDIEAGLDGEREWGDIISEWLDKGWAEASEVIGVLMSDLMGEAGRGLESHESELVAIMEKVISAVMKAASDVIVNQASHLFQPITDSWYGVGAPYQAPELQYGTGGSGDPTYGSVGSGSIHDDLSRQSTRAIGAAPAAGGTTQNIYNVQSTDPKGAAAEIGRELDRRARIGLDKGRNF
jgi:hypothetical protein